MTRKELGTLLKETAQEWSDDHAPRLGAALAYYTIFSLAPLLLIVLFVVGLVWGGRSGPAQAQILGQVEALTGPDGAALVQTMLEGIRPGTGSTLALIAGVVALFFGATGVFAQLQSALNTVWDVRPKPGRGLQGFVTTRLLSFGMVLGIGFLLLVSLIFSALLAALDALLTGLTPATSLLFQALHLIVSFGLITLLFALLFRYLPDVEIAWRDVWIGATVTALLFTLGKFLIGLYLGNSSTASTYGAAGSLVVLLLWIYYSAQIFFFGAELTQVYARRYGSHIHPTRYALRLPEAMPVPIEERPLPIPTAAPHRRPAWKRWGPLVLAFLLGCWWESRH